MGIITNLTTLLFIGITIAAVGKMTFDPPKEKRSDLDTMIERFKSAINMYSESELLPYMVKNYNVQLEKNAPDGWSKPVEVDGVYYVSYGYKGHAFRLRLE